MLGIAELVRNFELEHLEIAEASSFVLAGIVQESFAMVVEFAVGIVEIAELAACLGHFVVEYSEPSVANSEHDFDSSVVERTEHFERMDFADFALEVAFAAELVEASASFVALPLRQVKVHLANFVEYSETPTM